MKREAFVVLSITLVLATMLWGVRGARASPLPEASTTAAATVGTQYLTIPAAAFRPFEDGYDYQNDGRYLVHLHSPGGGMANGWYLAPVHLPHGATITRMTFYFYDDSTSDIVARLQRSDLAGNYYNMASVDSVGYSAGWGNRSTTAIANPVIDNRYNSYWVIWDGPVYGGAGHEASGVSMIIEYAPPATVAGILSIPAAAFTPYEDSYDYENHGRYLVLKAGATTPNGVFAAPVQLPHGATITKMTFYYYDHGSGAVTAILQRTDYTVGNFVNLASVTSQGDGGYFSGYDDSIDYATVDNSHYGYWVVWSLLANVLDYKGCGVVIEYTLPATGGSGPLSISAAAFMPYEDGYDYENHGRYLKYFHDPNGLLALGSFYAPVELPHGATVTQVTYYYYNTYVGGGSAGGINLQRTQFIGNYENMAGIGIGNFGQGYSSYTDDTIDYSTIDNAHYSYWVVLGNLPVSQSGADQQIWGCGVVIEYSFRAYLPLALR